MQIVGVKGLHWYLMHSSTNNYTNNWLEFNWLIEIEKASWRNPGWDSNTLWFRCYQNILIMTVSVGPMLPPTLYYNNEATILPLCVTFKCKVDEKYSWLDGARGTIFPALYSWLIQWMFCFWAGMNSQPGRKTGRSFAATQTYRWDGFSCERVVMWYFGLTSGTGSVRTAHALNSLWAEAKRDFTTCHHFWLLS